MDENLFLYPLQLTAMTINVTLFIQFVEMKEIIKDFRSMEKTDSVKSCVLQTFLVNINLF